MSASKEKGFVDTLKNLFTGKSKASKRCNTDNKVLIEKRHFDFDETRSNFTGSEKSSLCNGSTYKDVVSAPSGKRGGTNKGNQATGGYCTLAEVGTEEADWEKVGAKPKKGKCTKYKASTPKANKGQYQQTSHRTKQASHDRKVSREEHERENNVDSYVTSGFASEPSDASKWRLVEFPEDHAYYNEDPFIRIDPFRVSSRYKSEPNLLSKIRIQESGANEEHLKETMDLNNLTAHKDDKAYSTEDDASSSNEAIDQPTRSNAKRSSASANSVISISVKSQDYREVVAVQTGHLLDDMYLKSDGQTVVRGIQTQLYKTAKESLQRRHKPNILILKESGYGCNFVARMLFSELCLANDDRTTGYLLLNQVEWQAVKVEKGRAVVLIPDAEIKEWSKCLKHDIFPLAKNSGNDLTVIITTQDECATIFKGFEIDPLSCYEARPSKDDKEKLFDNLAKCNMVKIITEEHERPVDADLDDRRSHKTMSTQTKAYILTAVGDIQWVNKLYDFFDVHFEEGPMFFRSPVPELVNQLREIEKDEKLLFMVLLCVFAHGSLTTERLNQIGDHCKTISNGNYSIADKINMLGMPKSLTEAKKNLQGNCNIFYSYCKKHILWKDFGNEIHDCVRCAVGRFLDEKGGNYTFANENIKNSFMVVLCEHYFDDVVSTCDEWFLFYVIGQSFGKNSKILVSNLQYGEHSRKTFFDRVKNEWMKGKVSQCLNHPCIARKYLEFMKQFKKPDRKKLLQTIDNTTRFGPIYHGLEKNVLETKENDKNVTEAMLRSGKWKKIRKQERWIQQEAAALKHAAELSNKHTFERFIDHGVPITEKALLAAIHSMATGIVDLIIQHADIPRLAWHVGLLEALKTYADHYYEAGAKSIFHNLCKAKKTSVNFNTHEVKPLLHEAVSNHSVQMLKILLEDPVCSKITDVNLVWSDTVTCQDTVTHTALSLATEEGFKDIVVYLLDKRANQRQEGLSARPVTIAAKEGKTAILELLVDENLNIVNEKDRGASPLLWACHNGNIASVKYLLRKSRYQLNATDNEHQTPLHIAVKNVHLRVVKFLLENGADVELKDQNGNTPLQIATIHQRTKCAELIRKHCSLHGIDQDEEGFSDTSVKEPIQTRL